MRSRIFCLLASLLLAAGATLAQATFKIQAPAQAEVGQRIRVSYVANTTDVEDFQIEDFQGFDVLYGPSTSRSSNYSFVNGHASHASTLTFTYTLMPNTSGTLKLPVAAIRVDGKTVRSGSASIEVLPASSAQGQQQGGAQQQGSAARPQHQQQGAQGSDAAGKASGRDHYMTVTASRHKIYEQEAVVLTYKLYTLLNIRQISGEMPQIDGCHVQELDRAAQLSLKYEHVNGRNYGTAVWKQYVLFPQKTGKLRVPSITFDTQVEVQNQSMDPFDVFFGGGSLSQMVSRQIVAPSVEIEVMPLPTPRPDNFCGGVGKFSISASLSPSELNANDAATLRLVVSGQGNMKLIKAPKVHFPQDFEVYDPKEDSKTTSTTVGSKGNIVYDYVVVPRHGGRFVVPPVEFCYFDPEAGRYNTLRTDSFALSVAKAKGHAVAYTREQEDLNVLNSDIRYIKLGQPKRADAYDFFGTTAYWLAYAALLVAFALLMAWLRHMQSQNPDSWSVKGRKAGKVATRRLKLAAKLMHAKDTKNDAAFYDEIMRALLGYAGDKLSLPTGELTKDNVVAKLAARGVEQSDVDAFIAVLGDCEFARYAPTSDANMTKEKIYRRASDAITRMDALLNSHK